MKYRDKYGQIHGVTSYVEKISDMFVELNDRVNPKCQILNQYEQIVEGVLEPGLLRDQL